MNLKKTAAVLASLAVICMGNMTMVHAENQTEEAVLETTENQITESEEKTSEDSQWTYKVITNNETGEVYASLESYLGTDTEVTIPSEIDGNVVTTLGDYTFYENTAITKVKISETITDFGNFPFFACTSLSDFEVDEKNEIYTVKDGVLMGDDEQLLICYPPAKTETEYTIPDGVVALNPAAFATCANLKTVNFPETLERMGLYCFAECTSLNNVVIPESVDALSDFNFTGCTSLTSITLPDSMHTIGNGAFFSCTALDSIEFPKYIMEIGQCAFVSTGFTEIEIPSTVQEIGYSAFGYTADQQGQIIAMDTFTVKGLTGTMAQAYCGENEHVIFESTGESTAETQATEATTAEKSDSDEGMKPGVIAGICAAAAAVVIAVAVVVVKKLRGTDDSDDEDSSESQSEDITEE